MPDTVLDLKDSARGSLQTAKADNDGVFRFFFLAPGRYTLTVSHDGFRQESFHLIVRLGLPSESDCYF